MDPERREGPFARWLQRLTGSAGPDRTPEPASSLSAHDLLTLVKTGRAPLVVDVREPYELEGPLGSLPNALNIPLGQLVARRGEVPLDRDVVLVCKAGHRSERALDQLQRLGFTRIRHLRGGLEAFRAAEAGPGK